MGTSTIQPRCRFRVLATDWESESYTECWTESEASANTIASALRVRDVSVQIDRVIAPTKVKNGKAT